MASAFTSFALAAAIVAAPSAALAWGNGPAGNATTNQASECSSPPYATHDWIADHALALLPAEEGAWLLAHEDMYLLGTEAPDNNEIPAACGAPDPSNGYDDRIRGHSVEWAADWSGFAVVNGVLKDRAARRAQEEYDKAGQAFQSGDARAAAYYLGAMAHYMGDASQYGHSVPFEDHHSDYENRIKRKTDSFTEGFFEDYIELDGLVRRRAYTAVKRISKATARGKGSILPASDMDGLYSDQGDAYTDSIGHSLNMGVNELADVLHTFFLNVVSEDD